MNEIDPLTGDPLPKPSNGTKAIIEDTPAEPLTASQLAQLDTMDAPALRALVARMARQCGLVACMTPVEAAQAVRDRLLAITLKNASNGEEKALRDIISAANSWLDRVEGRPKQVIDANVNMSIASLLMQVNEDRDRVIDGSARRVAD